VVKHKKTIIDGAFRKVFSVAYPKSNLRFTIMTKIDINLIEPSCRNRQSLSYWLKCFIFNAEMYPDRFGTNTEIQYGFVTG